MGCPSRMRSFQSRESHLDDHGKTAMKTSVTISLVPTLSKGPWIYWEDLAVSISKAKAAGFDAVELFPASPEAIEVDRLASLLDLHQIGLSALGSGAGKALHGLHLISPDETVRLKARGYIARLIDVAAGFGAPVIIGSMQGFLEKGVTHAQALSWLREALNDLGERANTQRIKLILEPLNRYETEIINRLVDGMEMIRSLSTGNVTLLADLFHMNIEEDSLPAAIRAANGYIGFVHLADSNRRPAGLGHTPLGEIIDALRSIGYDGYISAEAFPYPDPDRAAAQTMSTCRALGIARPHGSSLVGTNQL
jgi:sugar phosphate isomerase/epimerase